MQHIMQCKNLVMHQSEKIKSDVLNIVNK